MKDLLESFKDTFSKELAIDRNEDYPTHIPVERMLEIVFEASRKAGMDSVTVLKHFQFTEEEIGDFFQKLRKN